MNLLIAAILMQLHEAVYNDSKDSESKKARGKYREKFRQFLQDAKKFCWKGLPEGRIRTFVSSQNGAFSNFITFCIVLNVLVLAMYYKGMSSSYENGLNLIGTICTYIFIVEMCIKMGVMDFY